MFLCYSCHAEVVMEKKKKYGNWKKDKSTEVWNEYKKSRQNAKRVISLAKGKKQKECARNLIDPNRSFILTALLDFFRDYPGEPVPER